MASQSKSSTPKYTQQNIGSPYVVAIGASAGGLEAIHEFFDYMPVNSGFTFVVIQHLSSDYKSLLVELVSKHTHMHVVEATHNLTLKPDNVYIIPNNKLMTIKGNQLKLADKLHDKSPNTAIDTFLLTLAQEWREKAIGVILSGTGTDGTRGIEAIKEQGGMVIVQEPGTAKFDGMPNSAIASGNADFILPPGRMHEELFNYVNMEPVTTIEEDGLSDHLLEDVFKMVSSRSGQDFNLYKTPTIIRRITRRMTATNHRSLKTYVDFLKTNAEEVSTLGKDFLIGVTKFFRDKGAFELLKQKVIPQIVDQKTEGEILKVWICACSTGEEAYSIAILIWDYLKQQNKQLDVKIFATDVDQAGIDIASHNQYPLSIAKEIDPELLEKYFIKEGRYYSVIPEIRKLIVFAQHNVIKSPPFIKNDLVTCRNMLIYMNQVLQQKVLATFHFALNTGGMLFLGSSETVSAIREGFTEINSKWRVYQKTGNIQYAPHNTYHTYNNAAKNGDKPQISSRHDLNRVMEDELRAFLVDEFKCVALYIDKNYEIRETVGDFKSILILPERKLELNLLRMVPQDVSILLNTAIRKAWKEQQRIRLHHVRIRKEPDELLVHITVKPPASQQGSGYTLVLISAQASEGVPSADAITLPPISADHQGAYLLEMEAELNETRTNLQMAVEEMETTNEELQSSNEELLSANEELQSSNEELQSLNEELHTLNTEHQVKIRELIELNEDLDNYFRSTDIAQIFIDGQLRIRKFNPAAMNMVNMIDSDIGRPINHLSNNVRYDNLIQDIHHVLGHGETVRKEVRLANGTSYLMQILPYLKKDRKRDGAVISFVDISTVTELNNIISGVFNSSSSAIMAFKAIRNGQGEIIDFTCITANQAAADIIGETQVAVVGYSLKSKLPLLSDAGFYEQYLKVVEFDKPLRTEARLKGDTWFQINAVKMADGFVVNYTNITDRRKAEQKLKQNYQELIKVREDLKVLNDQLETRIEERTQELTQSEERFQLIARATNDTIWDWNLAANQLWRSDNFNLMFGYANDQETSSINFWLEHLHPDDKERVEHTLNEAINNNSEQWSAEYRFKRADGSYAVILDRGSILLNEFGVPYRMVGTLVDITQLSEIEKKLTVTEDWANRQQEEFYGIFMNAPALISIRRGELLKYEFVNNAFRAFYGDKDYNGHTNKHIFDGQTDMELEAAANNVFKFGQPFTALGHKLARPNAGKKTEHWFDVIMNPVYNYEGKVDGVAFFGFDVTGSVKGQQATRELMEKKDEFMSIASHELKTPLTTLSGALQIALRMRAKEDGKADVYPFVEKANKQVGKLTTLVDDLLNVTRIQSGKILFNYDEFDAADLVHETVDTAQAAASKHKIVITKLAEVNVHADRVRIEQVLNNFLMNAVKYSPGADRVEVFSETDGKWLVVSVKDYGIGIPEDKKAQVFDRFFRVAEASHKFSGLGLGLYISADIIRRHGGSISLETEEGKGSTFQFKIPLRSTEKES